MQPQTQNLYARIGLWSAVLLTLTLIVYTFGLETLLFSNPDRWKGVAAYARQIGEKWHTSLTICHITAFTAAPLYLIILICLDAHNDIQKQILTRISVNFAIIFTVLGSIAYFIQFAAVKMSIAAGNLEGLEQLIQLNPNSALYSIVTLGWTFFLGLSALFVAPMFCGSTLNTILRFSFLINGISCMLGFIGYIIELEILVIVYLLGMGISMLFLSFCLIQFFRKSTVAKQMVVSAAGLGLENIQCGSNEPNRYV